MNVLYKSLGKTSVTRTSIIQSLTMDVFDHVFIQIENLDRRYRQLSIEYEALRSQPKVSYSEYESRYAEVSVLLSHYFIYSLYKCLGKTKLTRTSIFHLIGMGVLNDLFLQISIQERRYRQLASEYEALRSQPRVSYSEYEVRYAEVCILFVYYYLIYFLYKSSGKTKLARTSIVFLMILYLRNDLFLQIESLERRYRQLSIEYEQYRSQPKINYSEYEVRYSSVCALSVYYSNVFFRVNFQEKRSLQAQISELELELQRANGQIKVSLFCTFSYFIHSLNSNDFCFSFKYSHWKKKFVH